MRVTLRNICDGEEVVSCEAPEEAGFFGVVGERDWSGGGRRDDDACSDGAERISAASHEVS